MRDLAQARQFYEAGLGWTRDGGESGIAFYQLAGIVLGLYEWPKLAKDAGVPETGSGFRAVALAYCARSQQAVRDVLAAAKSAGATILIQARNTLTPQEAQKRPKRTMNNICLSSWMDRIALLTEKTFTRSHWRKYIQNERLR